MIFCYSIFVFCFALWALFASAAGPLYEEHGVLGLVVSMLPAAILLSVGLSMLALTKWAIIAAGLNMVVMSSGLLIEDALNVTTIFWSLAALAVMVYSIWLRRVGVLT